VRELNFPSSVLIISVYFHPGTTLGREFKMKGKKREKFTCIIQGGPKVGIP